jgi:hypothetical protein
MGWLEGLLSGYQDRSHTIAEQKMQEAMLANQREASIYNTLLNSDDPEIKSMAAAGIFQSGQARRRRGGLQGWMGEVQKNPIYPRLQEYFQTPKEKITTAPMTTLPSTQSSGYLSTPPGGQGSMAMPATSPTQAGAPPPAPPSPAPDALAVPAAVDEPGFQQWYADAAKRLSLDPNPDDPRHQYNYRAAYAAGVTPPDQPGGHWPSPYKLGGHENLTVGGFDTVTGQRVPGTERAQSVDELVSLGWSPTAATALMAQPEPPGAGLSADVGVPPTPPPGAVPGVAPTPLEEPPGPMMSVTYDAQGKPLVQGTTSVDVAAPMPTISSQPSPSRPYEHEVSREQVYPTFPSTADLKKQATRAEIAGRIDEYAAMFKAADPSLTDQQAAKQAAEFYRDIMVRQSGGAAGGFGTYAQRARADLFPGKSWTEIEDEGLMGQVNQKAGELAAKDAATRTTEVGGARANVPLSKPERFAEINKQRASWEASTKSVKEQHTAVTQMKTALAAIDKRGDWAPAAEAIIVKWQKALDPTSVVREAEAERPTSFQSLINRAEGALAKLARGGSSVTDIAAYVQLADEMAAATASETRNKRKQITELLNYGELDPWLVFVDSTLGLGEGEQPFTGPTRDKDNNPIVAPTQTATPTPETQTAPPQAAAPQTVSPVSPSFSPESIKPAPSHTVTAATPPPAPPNARPGRPQPNRPGTLGATVPGMYVDRRNGTLVVR